MTGLRPENPLDQVFTCPGRTIIAKSQIAKEKIKKCVQDLETALSKMHREVVEKSAQLRAKKRAQKDQFRTTPLKFPTWRLRSYRNSRANCWGQEVIPEMERPVSYHRYEK